MDNNSSSYEISISDSSESNTKENKTINIIFKKLSPIIFGLSYKFFSVILLRSIYKNILKKSFTMSWKMI